MSITPSLSLSSLSMIFSVTESSERISAVSLVIGPIPWKSWEKGTQRGNGGGGGGGGVRGGFGSVDGAFCDEGGSDGPSHYSSRAT